MSSHEILSYLTPEALANEIGIPTFTTNQVTDLLDLLITTTPQDRLFITHKNSEMHYGTFWLFILPQAASDTPKIHHYWTEDWGDQVGWIKGNHSIYTMEQYKEFVQKLTYNIQKTWYPGYWESIQKLCMTWSTRF